MPSLFRFLVVAGIMGGVVVRRTVRHVGVFRARAEGDSHARAGRQGASLARAALQLRPGGRTPMRAARHSRRTGAACAGPRHGLASPACRGARTAGTPSSSQRPSRPRRSPAEAQRDRSARAARADARAASAARARDAGPAPWTSPRGGSGREGASSRPSWRPDASGLPLELWRGLDLKTLEELLAGLDLPPRSPALHQLWRRMLLSSATPPAGAPDPEHFVALRLEALYRSGPAHRHGDGAERRRLAGPVVQTLRARRDIGLGRREAGCAADQGAGRAELRAARPPQGRDAAAGRLLRRRRRRCARRRPRRRSGARGGHRRPSCRWPCWRALPPAPSRGSALPERVLLLDYRFLELLGPVNALQVFDKAEPALLAVLAGDAQGRCPAADRGCRGGAASQRAGAGGRGGRSIAASIAAPDADPAQPRRPAAASGPLLSGRPKRHGRRHSARGSCVPILDDARRSGSFLQMARAVAPLAARHRSRRRTSAGSPRPASRSRWRPANSTGRAGGPKPPACVTGWR